MIKRGSPTRHLDALTGLRFAAAFLIFVFHVHIRTPLFPEGWIANVIGQGAVGMSVFFMLSGFILAHRYLFRPFDDRAFMVARIARIYPVYILSFVLALPMLTVQMTDLRFGMVSMAVQLVVILMAGIMMLQAWMPMLFSYANNNAGWSVSAEVFFYAVFALVVRHVSSLSPRAVLWAMGVIYLVMMLPPLAYFGFENRPSHGLQIFYAMPIFRLGEFLLGVLTFAAMTQGAFREVAVSALTKGLLIALFAYLATVGPTLPLYIGHNWIVVPTVALCLVYLHRSERPGHRPTLLARPLTVYLGKISFSFYCFQFHVLLGVRYLWPEIAVQPWLYLAVSGAILTLVSMVAYHAVEEPMRRLIRRRFSMPGAPVSAVPAE